jgi:glycosyltransferase involved in cell wall biosynthesis
VPEHQLGVVARPDPADFASQTVDLLADPARREQLGHSARRAAETVMSWDRMTDDLEAFYLRVLGTSAV